MGWLQCFAFCFASSVPLNRPVSLILNKPKIIFFMCFLTGCTYDKAAYAIYIYFYNAWLLLHFSLLSWMSKFISNILVEKNAI